MNILKSAGAKRPTENWVVYIDDAERNAPEQFRNNKCVGLCERGHIEGPDALNDDKTKGETISMQFTNYALSFFHLFARSLTSTRKPSRFFFHSHLLSFDMLLNPWTTTSGLSVLYSFLSTHIESPLPLLVPLLSRIRTTKYNIVTFLPKNLFEQFHRLANVYFLFIVILNYIPQLQAFGNVVAMIPIIVVLTLTAIKDAFEDR